MSHATEKRKSRVRYKLKKQNVGKLRLSVYRSNKRIYAQIIDDTESRTLVSASSIEADMRAKFDNLNIDTAKAVGELLAKRAKEKKIEQVYFDRGACIFHGKVKALADAARAKGLKF